jgi:soluble lytic murein transglycosylase-like protein
MVAPSVGIAALAAGLFALPAAGQTPAGPPAAGAALARGAAAQAPRSAPSAAAAPRLSQVLPAREAARLRMVFRHLARGQGIAAAGEIALLEDRRLLGHVLAEAWTRGIGAKPDAAALDAWLAEFGDQPDAGWIAERRRALQMPAHGGAGVEADPAPRDPVGQPSPSQGRTTPHIHARSPALERAVRERARQGDHAGALAQIDRARFPQAEAARLRAQTAFALFQSGKDEDALRIAAAVAAAQPHGPEAPFTAGLAAWSLGRWEMALAQFEHAARAARALPTPQAERAAAACFWAARAAARAGRPALRTAWLMRAAAEPRSLHGMVARRMLGLPLGFAWRPERLGEADAALLRDDGHGWRALALLQIGQAARAEAELRLLWTQAAADPPLARAAAILAGQMGLPEFPAMAAAARPDDPQPRDFLRYPLPPLHPPGGFRLDPALIYGLALQESRFDFGAVSSAGARGLLQLMPLTASEIGEDESLREERLWRLHDPALSLDLAQRYLLALSRMEGIGNDLIRILAAYNAGPGNLAKWLPFMQRRDDPFLFFEAIPFQETRDFVRRVLPHSWAYASRLGLPAPSLDALAGERFPTLLGAAALMAMLAPPTATVAARAGPRRQAARSAPLRTAAR